MALVPSKRQINWSAVSFTPSGGVAVSMTNVQDVSIESNAQSISGDGDANIYNTFLRVVKQSPSVSVTTQDGSLYNSIIVGAVGVWVGTHNDATNTTGGTGSGALTYTLNNAVVDHSNASGSHAQLGTRQFVFKSFSVDGVTSPLTMSIA